MKKLLAPVLLLLFSTPTLFAQTKVFKEVNDEISSQIRIIQQDGALVGYVVFTQLEKANEDSFNYKITIMDENLNDIGTVNFREEKLSLQAAAFEQDVLCLAYLKSNFIGNEFKNNREYRAGLPGAKNAVFTQFLGLNGKIFKTNATPVTIKMSDYMVTYTRVMAGGKLKYSLQLRNIPQKGFACFYGDEDNSNLVVYNLAGTQTWKKAVKEDAQAFLLLTAGHDAWLLLKKKEAMIEGGFELLGYDINDSTSFPKYVLKDKQGNSLKVLAFDIDPLTGKPYITGNIIDPAKGNDFILPRHVARGTYSGVFSIALNGHKKNEFGEVFSYWSDGSQSTISKNGLFADNDAYTRFSRSFKDYQGNTYFAGSSFIKRPKWVAIGFTILTSPLIIPPLAILGMAGTQKAKVTDAILLKQNAKGVLTVDNTIAANNSKFYMGRIPLDFYDSRSFYSVYNADTKTNYLIVDDTKDIFIYNVNQKKTVRSIPHKDGNIRTYVFPAKEGHVMVSEYNKKERYTRFSIESL